MPLYIEMFFDIWFSKRKTFAHILLNIIEHHETQRWTIGTLRYDNGDGNGDVK